MGKSGTGFVEDGFNVRDPIYGGNLYQPSPDAISSYRVVRGFDSAQYGGEPSVVYLTSRSGTNKFHGAGFWFVGNSAFNARTAGALSVSPLVYNQLGLSIGGPVLPKLKNKSFFFASVEGTLNHGAANYLAIVPTVQECPEISPRFPRLFTIRLQATLPPVRELPLQATSSHPLC